MSGLFGMIANAFGFSKKEAKILVVGLDNSGKTTLIHHLKAGNAATSTMEVTPTVGFQIEEFKKNNINFTVFDMSGQGRYRSLWEHYYKDAQAIIYVLDSADKIRTCVVKEELDQLLKHAEIVNSNIPVLFFANKMDLVGAMTADELCEELDLDSVRDKAWHIVSSNAKTGQGIDAGIEWLCQQFATSRRK